ncbi:MAG TPA: hypothetical protein V6C76_14250 [Drouetiella sp.]
MSINFVTLSMALSVPALLLTELILLDEPQRKELFTRISAHQWLLIQIVATVAFYSLFDFLLQRYPISQPIILVSTIALGIFAEWRILKKRRLCKVQVEQSISKAEKKIARYAKLQERTDESDTKILSYRIRLQKIRDQFGIGK